MRVLIIEDELLAAERLEEMLKSLDEEIEVLARIPSVKESVAWLRKYQADLIFLDIQLSDGISFSIFEEVAVMTPVIITTAFDQYAIKAFELNSLSYLLKPIRKSELEESLAKFKQLKSAYYIDFQNIIEHIQNPGQGYKKRFLIQVGEKLKKIPTSDIAYFHTMGKGVYMKTHSGESWPLDLTLENLETLVSPEKFFRINRKYLICIDAILQMHTWSRRRVKLHLQPHPDEKEDIIVSLDRAEGFRKWLDA